MSTNNSTVPVSIFLFIVSSSLNLTIPEAEIVDSTGILDAKSTFSVSPETTIWVTPYSSLKSINSTPPKSLIVSKH